MNLTVFLLNYLAIIGRINAGDIYLNNNETSFLKFNKKVSGL